MCRDKLRLITLGNTRISSYPNLTLIWMVQLRWNICNIFWGHLNDVSSFLCIYRTNAPGEGRFREKVVKGKGLNMLPLSAMSLLPILPSLSLLCSCPLETGILPTCTCCQISGLALRNAVKRGNYSAFMGFLQLFIIRQGVQFQL